MYNTVYTQARSLAGEIMILNSIELIKDVFFAKFGLKTLRFKDRDILTVVRLGWLGSATYPRLLVKEGYTFLGG